MAGKVMLGDIVFSPGPANKIQYANPRTIAVLDIPGAAPALQDMGEDATTISWSGKLISSDAYQKALQIEKLKNAGQLVQLTTSDFPELSKQVRIRTFSWDVVRVDRVDYSIELVVDVPPPVVNLVMPVQEIVVPQEAVAAPAAPTGTSYTIVQGDTLWALAVSYYGDGTRWREIADANGITNPRTLQIGQEIIIP
ncbi:MAG TPA: LysM domain-containing protein [Syntrophomonadaceae bacterium]|nr:LysM domain-containing protein [Syntrophomonadaceae bacterium]